MEVVLFENTKKPIGLLIIIQMRKAQSRHPRLSVQRLLMLWKPPRFAVFEILEKLEMFEN